MLLEGQFIRSSYFVGPEVRPQIGRLIGPGDDRAEREPIEADRRCP
jgi:hypothetical protein